MKKSFSSIAIGSCVALLFGLCSCNCPHEKQGKEIGKQVDHMEKNVKKKAHEGKEVVEKKAKDLHENAKDKAHDIVGKS